MTDTEKREKRVWLSPNVASHDMLRLFQHPEEWHGARDRVNVFSFIQWAVTLDHNPMAGSNHADALIGAVPGGAFRWLNDHGIEIAIEAGAIKEYSCADRGLSNVRALRETLGIIEGAGARVSYVVMDEPFVSALPPPPQGCGWSIEHTAEAVKGFIDEIHTDYPHVQIGMVEAYPEDTPAKIGSFLHALQDAGCALPFLHLDIDYYRVKREHPRFRDDLLSIQAQVLGLGLRFGVVVWGQHGDSSQMFCADAIRMAEEIDSAIGFSTQDNVIFQSWSPTPTGEKVYPDNLPESAPNTMTRLLLGTLDRYGVSPAPKEAIS